MSKGIQASLFSKSFLLVFICRFSLSAIFMMLSAVIAPYAIDHYGISDSLSGVPVGAFILATLVSRFFVGRFLLLLGYKRVLVSSAVAVFATTALYLIPMPYEWFIVVRILNGFVFGIHSNTTISSLVFSIPQEKMGEGLAWQSLVQTLSSAIGPCLGIFLWNSHSFYSVFIASFAFALVTLITSFSIRQYMPGVVEESASPRDSHRGIHSVLEIPAIPLCLFVLLLEMLYSGTASYIAQFASDIGDVEAASWFYVSFSAMLLISRPYTGRLYDAKGDGIVMIPSFIIGGIGYAILGLVSAAWAIIISGAFIAYGRGTVFGTLQTIVLAKVPNSRAGIASATFFLFCDLGTGVGPIVFGFLMQFEGGMQNVFLLQGLMMAVMTVLYVIGRKFALLRME